MGEVTASKLREELSDLINQVAYNGDRIVIRRNGKEVAALISVEDLETLRELEDRAELHAACEALKEADSEGTAPWEDVKRELGL